HGCDTLIRAPHSQLLPEDRIWLVEKCDDWKKKLALQHKSLDAGASSESVLEEADAVINKLVVALRLKANSA
ncbi:MAG: hypothetical protein KDA66_09840, partial [Planctomycetaceae bacterium]|nr:hypothetical protein [Planctomycetaceae bacterium]